MVFIPHLLMMFIILPLSLCLTPHGFADDPGLAKLFQERGVEGSMVISSLDGKIEYAYNLVRSRERFVPASTFKILNTLIALQEGAIKNESEVIRWDGQDKGLAAWNQDQTLATAFPSSCIWFYQELAKRIGNDKYLDHLKKAGYGNGRTGPEVTTFWLAGNLKISPREQIDFLKKLVNGTLPYAGSQIQLVKKLMMVEEKPQYLLRAKTGWASQVIPQQGWYVGYVETKGQVWFFATEMEIKNKGDEAFRKEITLGALKAKGII